MRNIFITLAFILCGVTSAVACGQCVMKDWLKEHLCSLDYNYKGNVKTLQCGSIEDVRYDSLGNRTIDISSNGTISLRYDKDKKCEEIDFNGGEMSYYKRYERKYSKEGKIIEVTSNDIGILTHNNANEKIYCMIQKIVKRRNRSDTTAYYFTYYDEKGNDTAFIRTDAQKNIRDHTRKVYKYNKQGDLTEKYTNGKLSCHYTYEYGNGGVKTVHEYWGDKLNNIKHYDAKGNRIYEKSGNSETFEKYDEKNRMTERKTISEKQDGTYMSIKKHKDGAKEPYESLNYRNDTLVGICSNTEIRNKNELIIRCINGEEDESRKGTLVTDTTDTIRTFGPMGRIIAQKILVNSHEVNRLKYNYNNNGQLLSIVSECDPHKPSEFLRITSQCTWCTDYILAKADFRYDDDGRLLSKTTESLIDGETYEEEEPATEENAKATKEAGTNSTLDYPTYQIETIKYDKIGNVVEIETSLKKGSEITSKQTLCNVFTYYDE